MGSWILVLAVIGLNIAVLYYILSYIPNKLREIEYKQKVHFEEMNIRFNRIEDIINKNNEK